MGKWFAPLGKLVASGFAAVVLLSGCTSRDAGGGDLIGLEIEPQTLQLAKGTSAPLTATALYANGAKEDITELVGWLSANPAVATVSNAAGSSGRVSGVEVGSTQVTASYEGVEASANVEVTPAIITALAISPNPASVPKGMTVQLVATAVFSDGSTQNITADADWSSAAPAVATVGNDAASKGRLSGVELGQTTVSASFESLNASVSATVTAAQAIALEVTPSARSIAKGTTQQFTATAVLSDGSTQDVTEMAAWSSSNGTIAQVSNASGTRGRAQGLQVGSAQITASFQNRSGSASLTVTAAELSGVQISPTSPSIAKGTSRQFAAIAVFTDGSNQNVTADATWASSNPDVATISNAAGSSGLAQSKDEGTTEISFTYADRSASTTLTVTGAVVASIDVTPTNPSIAKGTQQQFAATATFTDATTQDVTTQASWSSTSPGVATVSNAADSKGLATGVNQGSASIRATYQNVTGATTLTVTAAVVTGLQITPTDPSIAKGTTQQFTATATFSDASTQNVTNAAAWASSDPDVASVSNAAGSKGRAQGLDTGESDISASYQGFDAKSTLTVTDAVLTQVQVTPASQQIPLGRTQQYTATGVYSDGTTQDLTDAATWSSSNADVIEISNAAPNQ
ncbi:MAG: Ig domain-containing protein, partial [Gammaproteobacteria bacterium]